MIDTKKGILYRLGNLPLSTISEEKGSEMESIQESVTETVIEDVTPSIEENKGVISIEEKEGEEKESTEPVEEESLPDDKKEEMIMETKPTELIELAVAPRESVVRYIFLIVLTLVLSGILVIWKREYYLTK